MQGKYGHRSKSASDDLADQELHTRHVPKSPASQRPNSALDHAKQLHSNIILGDTTT